MIRPTRAASTSTRREAKEYLDHGIARLADLQERLYAQGQWSVLAIFQAMDAAGKDSAIKHVMSGINPQGCEVHAFKAPSEEDLRHDFLWRSALLLPEHGRIGIFNRSYYEEVLVMRVHAKLLARQNLPPPLVTANIWRDRFEDIRAFERHLARSGTVILKFFLNVSREEAEEVLPGADRQPGEELEVLAGRCRRSPPVDRLHDRLRGHDPPHQRARRALVRGAGR
jgi:polyphosphate kinase 2 (PPK2 family)